MKIKHTLLLAATLSLSAFNLPAALVVHEWGTFTSFQGGDGALLPWKPLETSKLPQFVHNLAKPGLGRVSTSMYGPAGKGAAVTLQRMETPVIYFYSDRDLYSDAAQTVDLTVNFPKGTITEWYPQAAQFGPSALAPGRSEGGTAIPSHSAESMIRWSGLQIFPVRGHTELSQSLDSDTSGSHYFAARETDSDYVRPAWFAKESPTAQIEKFLFYRGVGNFTTPLRVTMNSEDAVTLANTGSDTLPNLFVLTVKNKVGKFTPVSQLKPGEERAVALVSKQTIASGASFAMQIKQAMSQALVKTGLYQREADAMVKTWEDSWFAEDGVRVLYVLPRAWTDDTLPMTLTPAPKELVRVMVGRAEVLTPAAEQSLVQNIIKAGKGDLSASEQTRQLLKSLGRFAEPAFVRALNTAKIQPDDQTKLFALLNDARKAN